MCTIHICCCEILTVYFCENDSIGSIGQLHLDSSMSEMRYLSSRTIFNHSSFAKMVTGFMKVLPFGCFSLFTGELISFC